MQRLPLSGWRAARPASHAGTPRRRAARAAGTGRQAHRRPAAPPRVLADDRCDCVQGDATYLIVKNDGTLADFGLNAVCTHLGCVVPWNKARMRRWCPAMCLLA